jgi:hypothetical protein
MKQIQNTEWRWWNMKKETRAKKRIEELERIGTQLVIN